MKISEIRIKNFESLKDVTLSDLGNLVVLIGKNSSGKSNVLDALYLFFKEFNLIEPTSVGPVTKFNNYTWHDMEIEHPIEITLQFKFDPRECEEIFPAEALKIARERFPESYDRVICCRRIIDAKTGWKTEYVKWADMPLLMNNKLVSPEDFRNSLIGPSAEITTIAAFPESAAAKVIGKVAYGLQNRVKGKFSLARVTRDSADRLFDLVGRVSILDSETSEMLRSLGRSNKREDLTRWADFERTFEVFSSMRLDVREGEIFARKNSLSLPMHLVGGGDQESLIVKRFLMCESPIIAIEEPEMHLHPQLIMHILKMAKEVSTNSQVFLATHSPIILDRIDVQNVWIARMERKETKFIGLNSSEEMRRILVELHASLSNVLFAERILLVEGLLEKVMLPILAKNMGIDPDSFHIIPVNLKPNRQNKFVSFFRGEAAREYHLSTWSAFSKKTHIPLFLLLYKAARREVEMLIREGALKARNCFIVPMAIENYIPAETLVDVLNKNYGLHLNIIDVDARKPRMAETERILAAWKKLHPGWKTFIAEKAAEKMLKDKIPSELKVLFENI